MLQRRGWGAKRRAVALAVFALAFSVAAPALAPVAGAASVRGGHAELHAGRTTHAELMARRRRRKVRHRRRAAHGAKMTPGRRKAVLASFIKSHPTVLAGRLKARRGAIKSTQAKATGAHPKAHSKKLKKHRKAKVKPKHKAHAAKAAAGGAKKKKKKKAASIWTLSHAAMSLGLLGLGAAGVFLVGTSLRPRRRRRTRPVRAAKPLT